MAPSLWPRGFDASAPASDLRLQWSAPGDAFSVLLILGGDVVGRALAQLAGSGLAPVAFSFGWVAYSVSALVSAVGVNRLMPPDPDCRCKVFNARSGYARDNCSWILARIMRDFGSWQHPEVRRKLDDVLDARREKDGAAARPPMAGLVVSVYAPSSRGVRAGSVDLDLVYWVGLPVIAVQLGLAAVPCGLYGDWGILLVTAAGTLLSLLTGLLPQWRREKWACRDQARDNYILTRGNGSQHAIVVVGNGNGFNLEDLASGQANVLFATNRPTRLALLALAALWILLLITAAGLKRNTSYLLAVGAIGILHNIFVAGAPRRPENFGILLDFVCVFGHTRVMEALLEVEERYEGVGRALRPEFFPGGLREGEERRWREVAARHDASRAAS